MSQIMICAGESSGDLHAGALTKELLLLDKTVHVFGMGGDFLRDAGGEVLFDIKKHGVMGFVEVVRKLPSLFKLKNDLSLLMDKRRPDCLVVIDYPDFNMRIAKIAHEKKIPVVSFISPSAWAWRKGRAKDVAKIVDVVAAIFPFERDVYEEAGAKVAFVGHPLVDIVKPTLTTLETREYLQKKPNKKSVLLLPGSRLQEIERLLPSIAKAAEIIYAKNPECDFYLPKAKTISETMLKSFIKDINAPINIVTDHIYDIMSISDVAIATSGTVTLEAALCNLPSVIVYKTSPVTAFIARRVISIDYIGLPNIVAGKGIMPELIQEDATPEKIAQEALNLMDINNRPKIDEDILYMKERLGGHGAVKKVAELVLDIVKESETGVFNG